MRVRNFLARRFVGRESSFFLPREIDTKLRKIAELERSIFLRGSLSQGSMDASQSRWVEEF